MKKILEQIEETNRILVLVEKHLYDLTLPPDLKKWSKFQKENNDDPYFKTEEERQDEREEAEKNSRI